jgi:hypothetical protein
MRQSTRSAITKSATWLMALWTLAIIAVQLLDQITEPWLWPRTWVLGTALIVLVTALRLRRAQ